MRPSQIVNLIDGVLDVEWNEANGHLAARGVPTFGDPRLILLSEDDRRAEIKRLLAGGVSTDDLRWHAPTVAESR